MADAPPPPLQMDATPVDWPSRARPRARAPTMRAPEQPIGWPRDTAPPRALTAERSAPRSFAFASATTEKASLISCASTASGATPAWSSALGTARAGATVKSTGAVCASAKPAMAQIGSRPWALANFSDVTTSAAAPSLSFDAFAAVTVPSFLKALRRDRSLLVSLAGSSSSDTVVIPLRVFTSTGAISSAMAAAAARARA
mmetsp:Transcript_13831/g.45134  ORF Transcript_13831/g.45134 Transcript_13831/m.45134 type:complete len:201 (-) Transcript_13831:620-1222(-)